MMSVALPWHAGEETMHRLLRTPDRDNPTSSFLTPQAANMFSRAPLLALGTLDNNDYPWTTLWGGEPGFAQPVGGGMVGLKAHVDSHDPVAEAVFKRGDGRGKLVSGLTIDLESRKRVKVAGKVVAGRLAPSSSDPSSQENTGGSEAQLILQINQSLGNCPKYINKKSVHPSSSYDSRLLSTSPALSSAATSLITKSDLFFISTANGDDDMDTNHRGGAPGFVRTFATPSCTQIIWPEYSGNRLYQTLGNLKTTPRAGLVFADFHTGETLHVTGDAEVLVGNDAADVLPRSNLAVRVTVREARHISGGLAVRAIEGEASPYNPRVRRLAAEASNGADLDTKQNVTTAELTRTTKLTPTISRYTFTLASPQTWAPGAWVALDFSSDLDIGYSHMRDDDPTSLNDDFIRTFTVSNSGDAASKELEITIRRVGVVTGFLARTRWLDVPVRGFGGGLPLDTSKGVNTAFVAGGVGITPLLAQTHRLALDEPDTQFTLFWTLSVDDTDLVLDTFRRTPALARRTNVFLTGTNTDADISTSAAQKIADTGASCFARRMEQADLLKSDTENTKWYACVSTGFRTTLLAWLSGRTVQYEDFNF